MGLLERSATAMLLLLAGLNGSHAAGALQASLHLGQQLQTGGGVAAFQGAKGGEQGTPLPIIQPGPGLGGLQPQGWPPRRQAWAGRHRLGSGSRPVAGPGSGAEAGSGKTEDQAEHKGGLEGTGPATARPWGRGGVVRGIGGSGAALTEERNHGNGLVRTSPPSPPDLTTP